MAIYCEFYLLKVGEGTPNETAADLFVNVRDYCEKNVCPFDGEIEDEERGKESKIVVGGFIPLKCYKKMPKKIRGILE